MSLESMPNILFLMTDEHRFDVSGFSGNPIVRTPNLDRIAAEGIRFDNAYTPYPVCVPGRQCIMSGQYPIRFGFSGWNDLPPGHLTIPRHFSRHAYYTAACGKLHHQGIDQMQGWIHRIGYESRLKHDSIENRKPEYFERYLRPNDEVKWPDRKEILRAGPGRSFQLKIDEYTVQGAENFIENYFLSPYYDREQGNHQPLMLKVSLVQPHYPYICDEELFCYYLNRVEPFDDEPVFDHPFLSTRHVQVGEEVSKRDIRRATAAYYGMVESADRLFGRVLDALERAGENIDEWIVIYTSDHGEMLGQHGIWEKQKFFEASVRVPLLISSPSRWPRGKTVDRNVNLTDLFATLCEMAGIEVPEGLDSRSLMPLIESEGAEAADWDHDVVSMFWGNLMIKRDDLKYQSYGPDKPEVLFDLGADPAESENLISRSCYSRQLEGFRAHARSLGFEIPDASLQESR